MVAFLILVVIILAVVLSTVYVVRQQTVAIIERFGKYHRSAGAGIHIRAPFGIDKIAAKIQLRVLQSDIQIETKTKDNVFVILNLAVQYRVDTSNVEASYYKLQQPTAQIQSYVENAIRSSLPKYTLDEAYANQEKISEDVFNTVSVEMKEYGYIIVKTLVTSIEPDAEVKQSMNEINAAQRKRAAAQELAEADRIKTVTAAKAEAEKNQLHGEGIANERKAIINGLSSQFEELKKSNLSNSDIMSILLTEQYLDTMKDFAESGATNTIFLPNSTAGADDIRAQVLSAIAGSKGVGEK
ncbi:MAG: SPFH domain-containing protein [Candidatus Ancillula sp.]|jgi:regulator of protease activity HflC (stomatin/prohibitin superfamily)|nr:SPFH domain-containing protein [Candidatus Ancillula sp.]